MYLGGIPNEQVDYAKPKASAGANSLRVSPLDLKSDRMTGFPETSLVSFTSNGKRKAFVADPEEASALKSNATPSQRGLKRSERLLIQTPHEERANTTVASAFTRSIILPYRFSASLGFHFFGKYTLPLSLP